MNDRRLCVCLLADCLRPPTKSANLNTQNVGQKIVSPLSAGPILKPKSALCVPTGRFGKRTRPLVGCYIYGRNWLQKLNTQSTPTKIDNLSPNAHAHTSAVPCRRVCDPLTTAKLVIRAEDFSLLHCFGPPHVIVTDKPPSYGASMKVIGNADKQKTARWLNKRAENSHQPFRRRERAMLRFGRMRTL